MLGQDELIIRGEGRTLCCAVCGLEIGETRRACVKPECDAARESSDKGCHGQAKVGFHDAWAGSTLLQLRCVRQAKVRRGSISVP